MKINSHITKRPFVPQSATPHHPLALLTLEAEEHTFPAHLTRGFSPKL